MARYRLTGISAWGIQWERKDDDKEIARRTLNLLSDRRMLYRDFSMEIEEDCVRSADYTRRELGVLISNPEISPGLSQELKGIQAAFRAFMNEVGPEGDDPWNRPMSRIGTDRLSVALGNLRGVVGMHVGGIASRYDLEVDDDLSKIVPDHAGWFFERF